VFTPHDGSTMNTLLLIEDDHRLAHMVDEYLRQSGFEVLHAANGLTGLHLLQEANSPQKAISLVLLDLMLPDIDGLEVCRRIRALPSQLAQTPVLMLTAKGDPMDRVVGLEIGADDYLPKPFEPRELLARIRAVLRRHGPHEALAGGASAAKQLLKFGGLELDRDARIVTVHGKTCELTSYQFDLLWVLAERAGRVLTRDQIMEAVRGRELEAFDRSIDVHMGRIRAAIEDDAKSPKRILTVRGVGYVFAKQQD
jgi:DNA-binding response OmpR family regulator